MKKIYLNVLIGTLFALSIPLIAMQFTDEVVWSTFDFIVAGLMLASFGFTYEYLVKKASNVKIRLLIQTLLIAFFVLIWIELAVGVFGTPIAGS